MKYFVIGTRKNGTIGFCGKLSAQSEGFATEENARKQGAKMTRSYVSFIVCQFEDYRAAQAYCNDFNERIAPKKV